MKIMDIKLYAIYRALKHLKQQKLKKKQIYIFTNSQIAIKKLWFNSFTGGQELIFKIM